MAITPAESVRRGALLFLLALVEDGARDGERGGGARRFAVERVREVYGALQVFAREAGEDVVEVERLGAVGRRQVGRVPKLLLVPLLIRKATPLGSATSVPRR